MQGTRVVKEPADTGKFENTFLPEILEAAKKKCCAWCGVPNMSFWRIHVTLLGAGDGIEDLGPVQAEHFLTSRAGQPVLDGLVLFPIAHDLRGDAALFQQLCIFIF